MLKHSKKTFVNKYFLSFKKRSTTKQQNMKNNRIAVTFLVVMLCAGLASTGQNTLKLRVSGNSSRFISEPQGSEVSFREVDSLNQTLGILKDFTHKGELGAEVEMMLSLSEKAWFGLEIGNSRMSGTSGNPGFSNFQFSNLLQLQATDTTAAIPVSVHYRTSYPLEYKTTLFNILGNLRFYPAPDGKFRPFVKATAGVSLVSTELALSSPTLWYDELPAGQVAGPPVLFSQGTPESEKGKFPAFTFGGGIGFEYQITEKIALYADGSFRLIHSDLVDGKPNMDFIEDSGKLHRFNTNANTSKLSFGIVYTLNDDIGLLGGGSITKRGGATKEGRTSPHLPFYKLKRF